jgi:antitoxin component YwqK of YwqJK toxin-antitoxin module
MKTFICFIFFLFLKISSQGQNINPYEYDIYRNNFLIAPSEYEKSSDFAKNTFTLKPISDGFKSYHYLSGKINSKGLIKNKVKEGKWTGYYESGEIESTTNYLNGLKEGNYISKFENGNTYERGKYKNDRKEGKWIYKDPDGTTSETQLFKDGKLIDDNISHSQQPGYGINLLFDIAWKLLENNVR